jgi:hypothetical protein
LPAISGPYAIAITKLGICSAVHGPEPKSLAGLANPLFFEAQPGRHRTKDFSKKE